MYSILCKKAVFKNLLITTKLSNRSGISTNSDVKKTADLLMKCRYLDELTGGKGIIFATGTPIITGYLRSEMPILRCLSKRASHFMVMLLIFINEYSILCIGIISKSNYIGCDYYVRILSYTS